MLKAPLLPFSIIQSFAGGLRAMAAHARLFAMMSLVPFIAWFATLMAKTFTGGMSLFLQPLINFPATFILGLQCGLILRFLVLQEFPLIEDETLRRARNREVMQGALVYGIVTFLMGGLFASVFFIMPPMGSTPEVTAPYLPFMLGAVAIMFWVMRWLWLYVPVALGWDYRGFYLRLKGWQGSMRIMALFLLCWVSVNTISMLMLNLIHSVTGVRPGERLSGVSAVLSDATLAAGTVALAVLFTCATAFAVKSMLQNAPKVEA